MLQKSKRLQTKKLTKMLAVHNKSTSKKLGKQLNVMRSLDSNKYAMDWCSFALQAESFEILHIENKLMNRMEMKL